jgi:hypothetical protein
MIFLTSGIFQWIHQAMRDFLLACFRKDPSARATATQLLHHAWLQPALEDLASVAPVGTGFRRMLSRGAAVEPAVSASVILAKEFVQQSVLVHQKYDFNHICFFYFFFLLFTLFPLLIVCTGL